MALDQLGSPLTDSYSIVGGQARLFERGAIISGPAGEVVLTFDLPLIGTPGIATGDPGAATPLSLRAVTFRMGSWELEGLHSSINSAFAERLALLPTGQPPNPVPITFGPPQGIVPAGATPPTYGLPTTAMLAERQLYDVAVRGDDGQWTVIAPHAVYFRSSWHDFGIAHVTDTHLARRIDSFRVRLEQLWAIAGRADDVQLERPIPRLHPIRKLPAQYRRARCDPGHRGHHRLPLRRHR